MSFQDRVFRNHYKNEIKPLLGRYWWSRLIWMISLTALFLLTIFSAVILVLLTILIALGELGDVSGKEWWQIIFFVASPFLYWFSWRILFKAARYVIIGNK